MGRPSSFLSSPLNVPFDASKALICPSPKLPTRMSPPNLPKPDGASVTARGEFPPPLGHEPLEHRAARGKDVDEAIAGTGEVVHLVRLLLRKVTTGCH